MSVIAYKDGTMASDSMLSYNEGIYGKVKKLYDGDGFILGVAGNFKECTKFVQWFYSDDLENIDYDEMEALAVYANGCVHMFDSTTVPFEIFGEFFAIGSGADYAMGAMAAGKSPEEAVEIACSLSTVCNTPVQKVKLEKED